MTARFESRLTTNESLTPELRNGWHPLSRAQRGLWLAYRLHPELQGTFNIQVTMRMRPSIQPRVLQSALETLAVRHAMLRARFTEIDGEPLQSACERALAPLEVFDVDELDGADVASRVRADQRHTFDVTSSPPWRVTLYRAGAAECVMCLVVDHLVVDGWSIFQLMQELGQLLGGNIEQTNRPSSAKSYFEYVQHERAWLGGKRARKQLDYWRDTLANVDSTLELRPDRPASNGQAQRTALEVVLPVDLAHAIRQFSVQQGVTPFVTLLAAYAILLHRLTGQAQVSIGSAMPTRGEGFRETVGNLVNFVVLPSQLAPGATVASQLRELQSLAYRTLRNKDYPFDALLEALKPERTERRNPYFRAFYVFQKARHAEDLTAIIANCAGQGAVEWAGFAVEPFGTYVPSAAEGQDLTLETLDLPRGICTSWQYDPRQFDAATIERFASAWVELLRSMMAAPHEPALRLPLLSEVDRERVLRSFNDTACVLEPRCVHELFEAHVAREPNALAVQCGERALGYSELNVRANRLARHLRALGVVPDARVGVAMERGIDFVVAVLAVWKAGGAYVPLDPEYPRERLVRMVQDSAPQVVLVDAGSRNLVEGLAPALVDVSRSEAFADQPETNLERPVGFDPRSLAYVIYTSGSTGTPKGVMNEHGGLSNLSVAQRVLEVQPGSRVLQFASSSFDASVWELVMALTHGASVHLAPRAELLPGRALLETFAAHRITHVTLPPSALALCEDPELPFTPTTVVVAGEALAPSVANAWASRVVLWNAYGPTETTVCATMHRCVAEAARSSVPIGRPIANTSLYVLDANREPLPVGVAGELYVGGVAVARGYWGRAALTAERFVDDPFRAGGRMYRTGDLGRWLPDGTLEFLGRADSQVKLRGHRIELGEIEVRLAGIAGVIEAAVIVRAHASGEDALVAYYVGSGAPSPDVIRDELRASLPDYMIPAAIVQCEAFARTPNGKLNRAALPAPDESAYRSHGYEAPRGEVEVVLAGLWAEVLQRRVGRTDNFFELGGSSLLAVRLLDAARRAGLRIDVRSLFASRTLADLAQTVTALARGPEANAAQIPSDATRITPDMLALVQLDQPAIDAVVSRVPGGARNVQDIYPLTAMQEGILFHHRLAADPAAAGGEDDVYLTPAVLSFRSRSALEAFAAALERIVERHDVLRTSFAWEGLPEPVQVVQRTAALPLRWSESVEGRDALRLLQERFHEGAAGIDLRDAPLLRVLATEDRQHARWLMLIAVHHILVDKTSVDLMLAEARAIARGELDQLSPPVPYRSFVAELRAAEADAQHEAFFQELLADVSEPTLPFGLAHTRTAPPQDHARMRLRDSLAREVREVSNAFGVSTASTLHLAWALVLARVAGRDDVVFGTVLSGRMQAGAAHTIGMFIQTLPMRLTLQGRSVAQSLADAHALLSRLVEHEHASLALAQRCSALGSLPLVSALFNYRRWDASQPRTAAVSAAMPDEPELLWVSERTSYPLGMSVDDRGGVVELSAQVAGGHAAQAICEMLEACLSELVVALRHRPDARTLDIEVMPEAERRRLAVGSNAPARALPQARCLHELFENWADQTPEQIAVVHGDVAVSYRELNRRANQLARHLRELGVGPDSRVAACLERGLSHVVATLATWKAGGAIVPLDPAYPKERLDYMLRDCAPAVLLVDGSSPLGAQGLACVDIARDVEPWSDADASNLSTTEIGLRGEHLAYVIYTSGSTGRPKGVMNEHRGLTNLVCARAAQLDLDRSSHVLQFASSSFDASIWELGMAFGAGATLHVVEREALAPGRTLLETLARHHITHVLLPPSVLALCDRDRWPASTRTLIVGGEAIRTSEANAWAAKLSLWNAYGPTEAAVCSAVHRCQPDAPHVPIGRPIDNVSLYVLNARQQLVPAGVAGEIYIAGAGVARGYMNLAELTSACFLPNPFQVGQRLYRTGDIGRWLPDGTLEFLGRRDHQVKLRGFRIELGEIEAQLGATEGVTEVIASVREDEPGDPRLVAYYVGALSAAALRARAREVLPEFMVPAAYVQLERFALTPNGKIDRSRLPAPGDAAFAVQGFEPPRGEIEAVLAEIWQDVLKRKRVGRNDNFFELGGHSLSAVRVVEALRARGFHVAIRSVLASASLAELALSVRELDASDADVQPNLIPEGAARITPEMLSLVTLTQDAIDLVVERIPGGAAQVQDIYPLTAMQEGMLFHHLLAVGPEERDGSEPGIESEDVYLTPAVLSFRTRAAVEAFAASLQTIIDRHDILRTSFAWEGLAAPVQVVQRRAVFTLRWAESAEDMDALELLQQRFRAGDVGVDLRAAPLLRGLATEDRRHGRWLLLLSLHHIVGDKASLEQMLAEARAISRGALHQLPPPAAFRTFVAQARPRVSDASHEAFFRELLGDVTEQTLPFGLSHTRAAHAQEEARLRLSEWLSRELRELSSRYGVTTATTLHLAWALVLARLSGREDVVFGTVLSGRMQGDPAHGLGMFIHTLPMRLDLEGRNVAQSLRDAHARLLQLVDHEHASLGLAQRCSGLGSQPLFSALFNYRRWSARGAERPAHGSEPLHEQHADEFGDEPELLWVSPRTSYPLGVSVDDRDGELEVIVQVAGEHSPHAICAMLEASAAELAKALRSEPESHVLDIEVMPEAEQRRLAHAWNGAAEPFVDTRYFHELFEAQAHAAPSRIAVVDGEVAVTYRELNAWANQLAHHLRARGVAPEARVALCLERGLSLLIATLATWKAGGAVAPLDPAYPKERLEYMLRDCAPVALLVDGACALDISGEARIDVEHESHVWASAPTSNLSAAEIGLRPDHAAYVIYTSGSTGRPKGVVNEHRGLTNMVCALAARFGVDRSSRVLQFASPSFDVSLSEVGMALATGATLHLAHRDALAPGRALLETLERRRITHVSLPASVLSLCDREAWPETTRTVIVGGEAMRASEANAWAARVTLWNAYGPTEAAVCATVHHCVPEAPNVPIGRPIDNVSVYVLNARRQLVPPGVAGELYIGGLGVARGYLKLDALTAERFCSNPFEPGGRLYRTGDMGRWRADGTLEFLGRRDHQVKVRGFRIELGEIEAQLRAVAGITELIACVREDEPGDTRIVVYYVGAPDASALRSRALEVLPGFMVPAAYVRLERFELTPNGKIDRKRLPRPEIGAYVSRGYEPPEGALERSLSRIWSSVLRHERIGRHDDFFELGGHSLTAVQMVASVQRELNVGISLRDVFAHRTLAAFAAAVERVEARCSAQLPRNLVPLRSVGTLRPLFGVHPIGGSVEYLRLMAAKLDPHLPVYGLEASGWSGDPDASDSLPECVARYVAAVRAVQSTGPYRIIGYSIGGLIAYAMAEALIRDGEEVELLGIIDARADLGVTPELVQSVERCEQIEREEGADAADLWFLRRNARDALPVHAREALDGSPSLDWSQTMEVLRAHAARLVPAVALQDEAGARRAVRVMRANQRLLHRYQPGVLPITPKVFVARESPYAAELIASWEAALGDAFDCVSVGGTHLTAVEAPHIDGLAAMIGAALGLTSPVAANAGARRSA